MINSDSDNENNSKEFENYSCFDYLIRTFSKNATNEDIKEQNTENRKEYDAITYIIFYI